MKLTRLRLLKIAVAVIWCAAVGAVVWWFFHAHIPARRVPMYLHDLIRSYGWWGPAVVIMLHVARSFLFVPTTALVIAAGSLYGPVGGLILSIVGENISASVAFGLSRFLGRRLFREHENHWMRRYDELLISDGFITVLLMRLLFFPFDIVNYGSGLSGVAFRQYLAATFIGLIPGVVTFAVLGDAFGNPRAFILFAVLFVATVGLALLIRRSDWVRKRLFAKTHEHTL